MFVPLTEFISRNAQWYPDKTAVIFECRRLSWRELDERANRVANYLQNTGISKGDRVAIVSQNCLEYPEITFGVLKAGAVIVPVSTMLRPETVCSELQNAEARALFAAHPSVQLAAGYKGNCARIVLGGREAGWVEYRDLLLASSDADPGTVLSPGDPYNVVYSSGTTGTPKGIVHSHQARLRFAMSCGLEFRVHNETVGVISTPLYTNGTQLIYLPTVLIGGTLVLMRSFDPLAFLELVESEQCTHAFLVPTQFIRLMEHPRFGEFQTSSLEIILSAAAPLSVDTKAEILRKFPACGLVELYGTTEGISTVLRPNEQSIRPGSVGKPRLGGDVKILGSGGSELPRGEIGEIAGSNFSMMTGYYLDPEKTREVMWYDGRGKPYIKTGDIGKLDEEGYLYIVDRKKELIISGGINVFPSDIEQVLLRHPEIAETAVVGIPDREWGERPLAVVVKKRAESGVSEEDLKYWANSQLAGYQRLAGVVFRRASLPRNELGKVLKNELRRMVSRYA